METIAVPDGAFRATVLSVEAPSPRSRRVTLGGEDLRGFDLPEGCWGPYLKLFLSRPDGALTRRTYSVRRFDRARNEIALDVMLHGPGGVGSAWARGVRPGDAVQVLGPGVIPVPPAPDWVVLAGDQTALPAMAFTLERLPRGARGIAFVQVEDAGERQAIDAPPGVEVRWLGGGLAEAVLSEPWPAGASAVLWCGAEACAARAIRAYARKTRGLDPTCRPILNYWKRGATEGGFDFLA